MQLTVLGSNGTYPTPGRPASGYLVRHRSTLVWCDAGPGTFSALLRHTTMAAVDAVVVSHHHPDHCTDLLSAFHFLAYGPDRLPPVPVFTTAETIERLAGFLGADDDHAVWRTMAFNAVGDGDRAEVGSLVLRFAAGFHSVPALVTRVESDHRSLVYTGDTGTGGGWHHLVDDADLLLAEASRPDDDGDDGYPYHLTAAEAAGIARQRRARRLMLTHIPPHLDPVRSVEQAEAVFDRPVGLAVPGQTIDL